MAATEIDFSTLEILASTSDKKTVLSLFTQTFDNRLGGANAHLIGEWQQLFDTNAEELQNVSFFVVDK